MSERMRAFAEAFFTRFGAQVSALEDELVVDLPPELANVFGKPRLYLVFSTGGEADRELSPVEDLLVYGSRVFEQMQALLAGRGEVVQVRLPSRIPHELNPAMAELLTRHKGHLLENETQLREEPFYFFNFRATYLSDEKQTEFITIALDAAGQARPDKTHHLAEGESLLPLDPPLSLDPASLRQMVEAAGLIARQQADARAAELEQALQPRLQKALLRLTTFYRRLSDEVNTGDPAQDETVRADLQRDLARKVADELESHRLRVTLTPLSYAVGLIPLASSQLTLTTPHGEQALTLVRDLYSGQVEQFHCQQCQAPLDQLALRAPQPILPAECPLGTCPLHQRHLVQACLLAAGSTIEPTQVPVQAGVRRTWYRWNCIENQAGFIYIGQGQRLFDPLLGSWIIMIDRAGTVVEKQKIGLWQRLFGR